MQAFFGTHLPAPPEDRRIPAPAEQNSLPPVQGRERAPISPRIPTAKAPGAKPSLCIFFHFPSLMLILMLQLSSLKSALYFHYKSIFFFVNH